MKKVDLHIHTLPSVSDHDFEFSENKLVEYCENIFNSIDSKDIKE